MKQITILLIFLLLSCGEDLDQDLTPPVLSVAPVDISRVTLALVFGQLIDQGKINPTFEYQLDGPDVSVVSASSGYIDRVTSNFNSNNDFTDYEVWVKPKHNSAWTIVYDHVLNLKIELGNTVNPGDTLGTVGLGDRFELQLDKYDTHNKPEQFCPFDYATDNFINQHKAFIENWCL